MSFVARQFPKRTIGLSRGPARLFKPSCRNDDAGTIEHSWCGYAGTFRIPIQ
jgi:hypothetical protein